MIPVKIVQLEIDENRQQQLVYFKEVDGSRRFPMVIGIMEISAIKMELAGIATPRPLTHDLLRNIIGALGARVDYVFIHKLEDNIYYALIVIRKQDEKRVYIDARPSDAVALAVRTGSPIYVAPEILEKVSI